MNRATCFLAYCWDDTAYEDIIIRIKKDIEKISQNQIEVILDKISFDVSDDFKEKERQIGSSDCVIVFFSPNFNRVLINEETHRGVYREYQYIRNKFLESRESVIPVLLTGERAHSVPKEFRSIIGYEMNNISCENKKNRVVITEGKSKKYYSKMIHQIIVRINNIHRKRDYQFFDSTEKYHCLLRNTSADGHLIRSCIIKTDAYDNVVKQRAFIVVGRKGSGKSTILEILGKLDAEFFENKYKALRPIYIDNIDLSGVYLLTKSLLKDGEIFTVSVICDMFWQVLFLLQGIYIVCTDVELYVMDESRKKVFQGMARQLKQKLGRQTTDLIDQDAISSSLPMLALEIISNYINYRILDVANYDTILSSVKANFTALNIMNDAFGRAAFNKYIDAVQQCKKRILISLDGFDTYSEDFRRNTCSLRSGDFEEYQSRMEFEAVFYRSIIKMAMKFKTGYFRNHLDLVLANTDFCIVLPQDRWDQISAVDRDSVKNKYCELSWKPIDLLQMVVVRLENYYEIKTQEGATLESRWMWLLSNKLKGIPSSIKVRINGRDTDFDIFSYMLRLSFWRPRDILLHLIGLLDLIDNSKKNQTRITEDGIKTQLLKSTRRIINEEFIQEYQNIFYNINDVLNEFKKSEILISFSNFCSKLAYMRFDASFAYDNSQLESKIQILYQLGIIGLYFKDKEWAKKTYAYHICFYFKDGLDPLKDILEQHDWVNETVDIIINPIFSKKLNLVYNTDEALCNYSWDELSQLGSS